MGHNLNLEAGSVQANEQRQHRGTAAQDGLAFYSTPTDLVRFGLANGGNVDGQLAEGMVMSLTTIPYRGIVIAVTSNVAHAATSNLALRIGEAFTERAQ